MVSEFGFFSAIGWVGICMCLFLWLKFVSLQGRLIENAAIYQDETLILECIT